jgi:hypothetical protein
MYMILDFIIFCKFFERFIYIQKEKSFLAVGIYLDYIVNNIEFRYLILSLLRILIQLLLNNKL